MIPSGVAPPRAVRTTDGRVVAGVAAGLAAHLHVRVLLVRLAFVVLALSGGLGVVLYGAFWAVMPLAETPAPVETRPESRGGDLTRLLALASLVVGGVLLLNAVGVPVLGGVLGGIVVPLVVAGIGAALLWRQADDDERARWWTRASGAARQTATGTANAGPWRAILGITLVLLGLTGVLVSRTGPLEAAQALLTALVLLAGTGLVLFPWAWRRYQESVAARRALIRSEERAEVAAHVHDSVLQTLTLIQRHADDSREVARLARTEERALRSWLYAPVGDPTRTVAAALRRAAEEVEQTYGASLDVVTVGDAPLDAGLGALVAAAREAMVNVAKHGGGEASVYAEVADDDVEVFVRDRGEGFDLDTVPADRLGVRESVIGRMERNGGSAVVRTAPGTGTEVRLRMPRTAEG